MKRTITLAAAVLLTCSAWAQVQSGRVLYEETIRMDVRMDGEAAQFAHLIPPEQKVLHVLYFTPGEAIFQPSEKKAAKEEEVTETSGGVRMRIQTNMPEDKFYISFKEGRSVELRNFMGRKFLVAGDMAKGRWKMTGNQKTVLDYLCQEAVMIRDGDTTTAWFTTAIPVPAGPHGWNGLPGLILAATRNGNISIVATSVTPGPVADGIIMQPKGGKKVTKEEFKAIVDEKMKEMGAEGGNGNQVIIRVRGN